jgi:hypothetical protein
MIKSVQIFFFLLVIGVGCVTSCFVDFFPWLFYITVAADWMLASWLISKEHLLDKPLKRTNYEVSD